MKQLSKDIYNWIKKPDEIPLDIGLRQKINILIGVLMLDILIGTIFSGFTYLIDVHVVKIKDVLYDVDLIILLLFAVVVMPIIEEILFRFPLKYKRNYLVRGLNHLFGDKIKVRWDRNFKYFIYFMAIAFGFIHLFNFYNNEILFYFLGPIIVGSQIIGGLILSYVRIKLGFTWSVIQHGLYNLIGLGIAILFFHNSNLINISGDEYSFRLTELMYINEEDSSFSTNIQNGVTYSIQAEDVNLQRIINSLNIEGEKVYHDTWVDFYVESERGISNRELLKLIKNEIRFDK